VSLATRPACSRTFAIKRWKKHQPKKGSGYKNPPRATESRRANKGKFKKHFAELDAKNEARMAAWEH
jgi:hypothetical protein